MNATTIETVTTIRPGGYASPARNPVYRESENLRSNPQPMQAASGVYDPNMEPRVTYLKHTPATVAPTGFT